MAKSKIEKYVIHASHHVPEPGDDHQFTPFWSWWARVPYGTYQSFRSWNEAAEYLRLRWELRNDHKTWRRR